MPQLDKVNFFWIVLGAFYVCTLGYSLWVTYIIKRFLAWKFYKMERIVALFLEVQSL